MKEIIKNYRFYWHMVIKPELFDIILGFVQSIISIALYFFYRDHIFFIWFGILLFVVTLLFIFSSIKVVQINFGLNKKRE